MELQRDYEFIKEALERLDVYMDAQFDKRLSESSHKLNTAVHAFTIVSLWFTSTQMLFDNDIINKGKAWTQAEGLWAWLTKIFSDAQFISLMGSGLLSWVFGGLSRLRRLNGLPN